MSRFQDGLDGVFQVPVAQDDVDLYFRKHVDLVAAGAAHELDAALAAMPADLEYVQSHDADFRQRVPDIVDLVFADDGFDFFQHDKSPKRLARLLRIYE